MAHDCSKHLLPAFGYTECYYALKDRLRAGTPLSCEEAEFIGVYAERPPSGGWHQPGSMAVYENDAELSAEDTELLQSLMSVGHADRLEFLG